MDVKLSTTVSNTNTYAGTFSGNYISGVFLNANSIAENIVTFKPNIAGKQVVRKGVVAGTLAASTCGWNPTGSVTLTERVIDPVKMEIKMDLCTNDFLKDWETINMGYGNSQIVAKNITDFVAAQMGAQISQDIENAIWSSGSTLGVSGFTAEFLADTDVVKLTGTTITKANVIDELEKVAILGLNIKNTDKHVLIVSRNVFQAYLLALGGYASNVGANGYKGEGTNQMFSNLVYANYKIMVANGLGSNKIVLADPANLWVGSGLLSDFTDVKIVDMSAVAEDTIRFKASFTFDVQYGIGSEIIYRY